MQPVSRAIWFIETHLDDDLTLERIAAVAEVSRYHIVRAFGASTGHSVMRYVRARRLSEAARTLAGGAPDILTVAVGAGYGSHEAFTRAFRERFGVTPESVRARGGVVTLELQEPVKMSETPNAELQAPRIENGRTMLIAGVGERFTWESGAGIPALWQRFQTYPGGIPGQVGNVAYGVCCNGDDAGNFDYIAGAEVADFSALPADLSRLRIGAQKYAVFRHADHIATIRGTIACIWNEWLPRSELQVADGPSFERYDQGFDPETGLGGVEIWIPVV